MRKYQIGRRGRLTSGCGALATTILCLTASSALAGTKIDTSEMAWGDTSSCAAPTLVQPFLSAPDSNWYTLAPGQSSDAFSGAGWTLSGGASVMTETLGDGQTGPVLDLPSGSAAISPPMCVSSDYPTARTEVRDVVGSEGVHAYVAYAGTKTATKAQDVGQIHGQQSGWTLSDSFNIHPGDLTGWQLVRFTFVPGGKSSNFQIYDFYVDPRMSR